MRYYEDKDYEAIKSWWDAYYGVAPDPNVLSEDGLVIEGVAASWLYMGNSALALIGWPVVEPNIGRRTAMIALEQIFREQVTVAKASGCLMISTYTAHPAILKLMAKIGFRKGDEGVTNMMIGV